MPGPQVNGLAVVPRSAGEPVVPVVGPGQSHGTSLDRGWSPLRESPWGLGICRGPHVESWGESSGRVLRRDPGCAEAAVPECAGGPHMKMWRYSGGQG